MSNEKVYENQKMLVEVDGIDTVFVSNKNNNSFVSIQVNDEEGFNVIYNEEVDLLNVMISPGGALEILGEAIDDPSESELDE